MDKKAIELLKNKASKKGKTIISTGPSPRR